MAEIKEASGAAEAPKEAEDPQAAEESKEEKPLEAPQEPQKDSSSQSIDYKGELERAQKRIIDLKKENKELKREPSNPEVPVFDEEEITQRIDETVAERVKRELEGFKVASSKSAAEVAVGQLTSNKDEQDLILHHYEHSVRLTGDLREDLDNAQALANKRRIQAQNDELKRAMSSKEGVSKPQGAGQKPPPPNKAPELPVETVKFLKQQGAKINKDGKWEFKNGTIYDPEEA